MMKAVETQDLTLPVDVLIVLRLKEGRWTRELPSELSRKVSHTFTVLRPTESLTSSKAVKPCLVNASINLILSGA